MGWRIGATMVAALTGMAGAQIASPPPPSEMQSHPTYETFYFSGEVRLDDSSPPPEPVGIYRVCNGQSHFEAWTDSKGNFSFEASGNRKSTAQGDADQSGGPSAGQLRPLGNSTVYSMPVVASLRDCELQAVLAGYRSDRVSIALKSRSDDGRVGVIALHPLSRAGSLTVSATTLQAPAAARKAYDRGLDELAKKKLQPAAGEFAKAVKLYPKFAIAWYQLGLLRQVNNDAAGAVDAWRQALAADPKYVRPYESLSTVADHNQDWASSEAYSREWIALDAEDFPVAYLFNAIANARLNRADAAEHAARAGLQIDHDHKVPRLDFVLGLILMGRNAHAEAAGYFREYLTLAPNAPDAPAVRQQLSQLDAAATARPE